MQSKDVEYVEAATVTEPKMSGSREHFLKYVSLIAAGAIVLTVLGILHWKAQAFGATIYGAAASGFIYKNESPTWGKQRIAPRSLVLVIICLIATAISTYALTRGICGTLKWGLHWQNWTCSTMNFQALAFNALWFAALFALIMTWIWYADRK
jgi:hypothetical protein